MRGLLEKDIRLLMHSKQTFVCFIALAVVLGVAQKSTLMLGYLTFFISAILVSTLSYDEMDHGFAFLFTLCILYGWSSYCLVSYDDALCDYIKCETYTGSDFRRSVERPFLFADCYFLSIAADSYAVKVRSRKKPPCNDRCFCFRWNDDLLFGRKKWNAGWKQRSRVVCFRLDRGSGGRCDRIAYSRCSGCGVIPVQLPYYEKERTVILTGII